MRFPVAIAGRSDDDRDALLLFNGQAFRWPDPDHALDEHGSATLDVRAGSRFTARSAGSHVLLQSADLEVILRFPQLLPDLPPRCDLEVSFEPAEINEGVGEAPEAIPQ